MRMGEIHTGYQGPTQEEVDDIEQFCTNLKEYEQAAIAAFAKRLTEGEQTACAICCFSSMESAANPEHYSCGLTDRPCPIRQAANLDKGGKG